MRIVSRELWQHTIQEVNKLSENAGNVAGRKKENICLFSPNDKLSKLKGHKFLILLFLDAKVWCYKGGKKLRFSWDGHKPKPSTAMAWKW